MAAVCIWDEEEAIGPRDTDDDNFADLLPRIEADSNVGMWENTGLVAVTGCEFFFPLVPVTFEETEVVWVNPPVITDEDPRYT